jgi:putative isomerase
MVPDALRRHLLEGSAACVRPPVDRFRHPWIAPMPLSDDARRQLEARAAGGAWSASDAFTSGDYGLGLFHHDVAEAAIELVEHDALRDACVGSLLCFLDNQDPDGRIHRVELPWKARETEPSKPVMGQLAARCLAAGGDEVAERFERERVLPRLLAWVDWHERNLTGPHGLVVTWSSLQSGFDNDLLSAYLPDRSVEGPDTTAMQILELEAVAEVAERLGRPAAGSPLRARAARLRELTERLLWHEDDRGGFYVALRWQRGSASLRDETVAEPAPDGSRQPVETWATLLPLYAGVPSVDRAHALIRRLTDPAGYWGPKGPRTVPAWSPYFQQAPRVLHFDWKKGGRGPVSNWSGPVWVLSSYYLAAGCARYGRGDLARQIAERTVRMLAVDLDATGGLHECYDDAGRGLWPQRGTFLSWNVLALTLDREHGG